MTVDQSPLFSVVIPTYNHAIFLGRALQSVVNQTYTDFEVIVVDNHSTDRTDEILAGFDDPRIRCFKTNNDGVIARSRNLGVYEANGKWIAFLDSDDWWTTDKLERCFKFINDEVDFVYHDLKIISDRKRLLRSKSTTVHQLKRPVLIDLLVQGNVIANSSVVVKKELLDKVGGINESKNLIASEDYHTWLKIAELTDQFFYIKDSLGFYSMHAQNMSGKNMSLPGWRAVENFLWHLSPQKKNKAEANLRYSSGRFNFLIKNFSVAKRDLTFSLRYGRFSIKFKSALMLFGMLLPRSQNKVEHGSQ